MFQEASPLVKFGLLSLQEEPNTHYLVWLLIVIQFTVASFREQCALLKIFYNILRCTLIEKSYALK